MSRAFVFAPVPDFRYVGLEPLPVRELRVASAAAVVSAGIVLVHGLGAERAALGVAAVTTVALAALGRTRRRREAGAGVRMGIVPWGVLVHADEGPRILRWAAVRRVDIATSHARGLWRSEPTSRVVIETAHDRFVGVAVGAAPLERLVEHVGAYAEEQSTPIALDLDGDQATDVVEPGCENLLRAALTWLDTARAVSVLELPPSGYRCTAARTATPRAIEVLGRVLRDRTPKHADPRPFAAVVAAELHATALVPDLVALTQCPHPVVAAVAKQAAHKLGAARSRIGTLDEVAPFLLDGDRVRLDVWSRGEPQ